MLGSLQEKHSPGLAPTPREVGLGSCSKPGWWGGRSCICSLPAPCQLPASCAEVGGGALLTCCWFSR